LKEAYDAATPEAFNDALKQMLNSMDKVEMGGVDLKKVLQELNPESYKEFEIILNRLVKEEEKLKTAQAELNNALAGFNP
jgi:exonuclease VII small subunit